MSTHTLKKQAEGDVPNAPAGYLRLFADLVSGLIKSKDESGVVRPALDQAANDLATTGDSVAVDSAGPPTALGQLLMCTGLTPPQADWQSAIGNANFPFMDLVNVPVIDNGDSPFSAVLGTLIPVDLSGGSVIVTMPAVAPNRIICVSLVTVAGGNTCTANRVGGDTIDGETSHVMSSDYESAIYRGIDLGGATYMWKQIA